MNTTPPKQPGEPTPYRKWVMDAIGMVINLLSSIAGSLKEIMTKSGRPRLKLHGKEIIMFEDLAFGLNKSTRTLRKLRSEGKMSYYISNDGRTIFLTQDQFEKYIENTYQCVTADSSETAEINNAPKSPA